jgi:aromatic-L-amino-acid decarboxylase
MMSPDEFRQAAQQHTEWIADYMERVRDFPVVPAVQPGEIAAQLPKAAPEYGEPIEQIFADFKTQIVPGLTLWNHPNFNAWFAASSTPPSILAEFLMAALNINAMLWKSSPAATELEQVTLNWLRQWLGLDEKWFGIIFDTASISVMQAMGAAREWIAPECRSKGMQPGLTVYVSEHTHTSAEKAAITLGFGQDQVRRIPVDDEFRMRPEQLERAMQADVTAGKRPCCIVASVGSTSAAAVEDVPAIADIAERYKAWLHVDAAYAGPAAIVPEMKYLLRGVERAHSLVINPHKWLYVSMDCSVLYTSMPEIFRRASSLSAEILRTAEDGRVVNFNDYGMQLGRRFRALKLWYVLRYYGREGIVAMLREAMRLAQMLKGLVEADQEFEVAAPVRLSLVCFRHRSSDDVNRQLLSDINASGKLFLSQTVLHGRFVLRFAIGNHQTTERDVRESWQLIQKCAAKLAIVRS